MTTRADRAALNTRADRPAAPTTEGELWSRAKALSGHTVAEIAARAGVEVPADLKRHKGLLGQLAEWATGAPQHTGSGPDFPDLGIELKTIPLLADGTPRESTFVCTIDLRTIADTDWDSSALRHKLKRVLWVPVQAAPTVPLAERRFGTPVLWQPSADQLALLRHDWELLVDVICRDDLDRLTAHLGQCLQVRPKAAHGRARTASVDRDHAPVRALPRGFYLRRSFTAGIFRRDGGDGVVCALP